MRKTKGSLGTKLQRSSLVKDLIKAPPRQKQLKGAQSRVCLQAVPPVSDRGRVSSALSHGAAAAPSLHQPNYFPGWLFCLFSSSAHVALSRRGSFLLDGFGPDASRLLTWTPRRSLRRKAAAAAARRSETDTQRLAAGAATMP
ncbi:hypothetical protein SRHO_G00053990 [Serrasalmus rhombeus]